MAAQGMRLYLLDLPDAALARVMSYLPLDGRLNASRACWRLSKVFYHPDVWKAVSMRIHREDGVSSPPDNLASARHILTRYGHQITSVELQVRTDCKEETAEWLESVDLLIASCAPSLLHLRLDISTTFRSHGFRHQRPLELRRKNLVEKVSDLIRACARLRELTIRNWPLPTEDDEVDEEELSPFPALLECEAELESLTFRTASRVGRASCDANPLQDPGKILTLVEKSTHVRELSLMHTMVNENILGLLTRSGGKTPLRFLSICASDAGEERRPQGEGEDLDSSFQDIRNGAWEALAVSSPSLRVALCVREKCDPRWLLRCLKPALPLAQLALMSQSYSTVGPDWIALATALGDFYHETLRDLQVRRLRVDSEPQLLKLLERCSRLTSFVVREGVLSGDALLKIAAVRGSAWYRLGLPRSVYPLDLDFCPKDDLERSRSSNWEDVALAALERAASEVLGYEWKLTQV